MIESGTVGKIYFLSVAILANNALSVAWMYCNVQLIIEVVTLFQLAQFHSPFFSSL